MGVSNEGVLAGWHCLCGCEISFAIAYVWKNPVRSIDIPLNAFNAFQRGFNWICKPEQSNA